MSRGKKWPQKVTLTLLDCGAEQAADIGRARHLFQVEDGFADPRPMKISEICREALYYLVDHLRAGAYRVPEEPRPGEARIVKVGKWADGA